MWLGRVHFSALTASVLYVVLSQALVGERDRATAEPITQGRSLKGQNDLPVSISKRVGRYLGGNLSHPPVQCRGIADCLEFALADVTVLLLIFPVISK